ncbi:MAG TPA: glycerol-3-phosphate 1-O-acyltransferase PlsY [Vicinamibacterales bacterium]
MRAWLVLVGAYAIGSIPFAWLVVRRFADIDLRRTGSGNIGAANAFRSTTPAIGILVALLDGSKGAGAVLLARYAGLDELETTAALLAVVGHVAPVWLRFRGGKGVATAGGALAVLSPPIFSIAFAIFIVSVWRSRYVSAGSIAAACAMMPAALWRFPLPAAIPLLLAGALIVLRHRDNIARLRAGTERRLTWGRRSPRPATRADG